MRRRLRRPVLLGVPCRLRGRPSGLKGRCRDRYATGPPLTPEPLRPLNRAAARAGAGAPARQPHGTQTATRTITFAHPLCRNGRMLHWPLDNASHFSSLTTVSMWIPRPRGVIDSPHHRLLRGIAGDTKLSRRDSEAGPSNRWARGREGRVRSRLPGGTPGRPVPARRSTRWCRSSRTSPRPVRTTG